MCAPVLCPWPGTPKRPVSLPAGLPVPKGQLPTLGTITKGTRGARAREEGGGARSDLAMPKHRRAPTGQSYSPPASLIPSRAGMA